MPTDRCVGERVYHARVSTDGGSVVPEAPKFGSLGKALSGALSPIVTVVSIAAVVVAIAITVWLGDVAIGLGPTVGYVGAIWSFAAACLDPRRSGPRGHRDRAAAPPARPRPGGDGRAQLGRGP